MAIFTAWLLFTFTLLKQRISHHLWHWFLQQIWHSWHNHWHPRMLSWKKNDTLKRIVLNLTNCLHIMWALHDISFTEVSIRLNHVLGKLEVFSFSFIYFIIKIYFSFLLFLYFINVTNFQQNACIETLLLQSYFFVIIVSILHFDAVNLMSQCDLLVYSCVFAL